MEAYACGGASQVQIHVIRIGALESVKQVVYDITALNALDSSNVNIMSTGLLRTF